MKDKRIVASLNRLSVPIDRRDAMLQAILQEMDAASAPQKEGENMERQWINSDEGSRSPRTAKRRTARRWWIPVAAALVAVATLFSIPSVSQAIGNWFLNAFRLTDYLAEPPETRESNPDIEQAIQTPPAGTQSFSLRYLDETEHYAGVEAYRKKIGFASFDRADYAWIGALAPETGELLYDGQNLIVNTVLHTSPLHFLGLWGYPGADGERFDAWANQVTVSVDGTPYTNWYFEGGELEINQYYDREQSVWREDAAKAAKTSLVQTTLTAVDGPLFPDGPVTVTIEIWIMDGRLDDMNVVGLVAILTETLTFDATQGNALLRAPKTVTQQLNGTVPLTFRDQNTWTLVNHMVDLSGVSVTATAVQRATGMSVTLRYAFPEGVDQQAYWDSIAPGVMLRRGVGYEALVDGVPVGKPQLASNHLGYGDDVRIEIPLTPSELAGAKTLTLRPYAGYIEAVNTKGDDRESATPLVIDTPTEPLNSYRDFYARVELTDCDVVIPLG